MPFDGNKPTQTTADKPIVGLIVENEGKLQLHPLDKKNRLNDHRYNIDLTELKGAVEGDIVSARRTMPNGPAVVTEVLGRKDTPGILSTISLREQGLTEAFNAAALAEARAMKVPELGDREDLRKIPLVTVDGPDSRDFDDAIYAEDTKDGGKHLIVAIADVSYYVRPGSELDKEAQRRGNSTYFPDRAVPMLPEELSNGLCSLKPHEDRAVMVYHLWIDKDGNLVDKKINRGLMRSAARLTYDQLQAAKDGNPDATTKPLMDTVVNPLYAAYDILRKAAERRGALELQTGEEDVASHDVIAQFMILANVAGNQARTEKGAPSANRFHASPPLSKRGALALYLESVGLKMPENIEDPAAFKPLIDKARTMENGDEIIRAISRAQSKAVYDSMRNGHYGLALPGGYGHDTSPIRRYADLENHRSSTTAFNLGAGGMTPDGVAGLQEICERITETEIRSARAERSAEDRYAVQKAGRKIGETFEARITGVSSAGLFVKVTGIGPEGLLLLRGLPHDTYVADKQEKTLTGQRSGQVYRAGDAIKVKVDSAEPLSTSLTFVAANDNVANTPRPTHPPKVRPASPGQQQQNKRGGQPHQRRRGPKPH